MPAGSKHNSILSIATGILMLSAAMVRAADVATTITVTGIGSISAQSVDVKCADNGTMSATVEDSTATTALLAMAREGKSIQSITVAEGPADRPTATFRLTNVLITSFQQKTGAQQKVQETMNLRFEKCVISYPATEPGKPSTLQKQ